MDTIFMGLNSAPTTSALEDQEKYTVRQSGSSWSISLPHLLDKIEQACLENMHYLLQISSPNGASDRP